MTNELTRRQMMGLTGWLVAANAAPLGTPKQRVEPGSPAAYEEALPKGKAVKPEHQPAQGKPVETKCASDPAAADRPIPSAEMDPFVESLLERSGVPGVSVAFLRRRELVWHRQFGYANREAGVPLTPDVLMQGASLTKPTFACMYLRLCEEGVCKLDEPLSALMPEFVVSNDARAEAITPRQILSHSSGLPLTHFPEWPEKLERAPGEAFSYSGAGYLCLQKVAERQGKAPMDELMRAHVVEPAGWRRSRYTTPRDANVAVAYEWDGEAAKLPGDYEEANAAASLYTTAFEYLEFAKRLLLPHHFGLTGLLGGEMSHQAVTAQISASPAIAWGLGWGIHSTEGGDRLFHWGDSRGFMHYAAVDQKEGTALVVLTNSRHGLRLCEEVAATTMGESERETFEWIYESFYEAVDKPIRPWPS